jgi:hypothetical protein
VDLRRCSYLCWCLYLPSIAVNTDVEEVRMQLYIAGPVLCSPAC